MVKINQLLFAAKSAIITVPKIEPAENHKKEPSIKNHPFFKKASPAPLKIIPKHKEL